MKKIFFIFLTSTVLFACKKNSADLTVTPSSAIAKVKTWIYGANITTYVYDAQGRQVKTMNNDGSKTETEYLPGIINRKVYNAASVLLYTYKYEMNADGFIARTTISNNPNYEELRQYNADKTLAKSITKSNGITNTADYFYSNGNCDSTRFAGNNGNWSSSIIRTYYSTPNVLNDINTGDDYYCKVNKNLLKTEIYKYADGSTNNMSTYVYDFDGEGKVIKQTASQGSNIEISLLTYY